MFWLSFVPFSHTNNMLPYLHTYLQQLLPWSNLAGIEATCDGKICAR